MKASNGMSEYVKNKLVAELNEWVNFPNSAYAQDGSVSIAYIKSALHMIISSGVMTAMEFHDIMAYKHAVILSETWMNDFAFGL